jgi:hypothetical protein
LAIDHALADDRNVTSAWNSAGIPQYKQVLSLFSVKDKVSDISSIKFHRRASIYHFSAPANLHDPSFTDQFPISADDDQLSGVGVPLFGICRRHNKNERSLLKTQKRQRKTDA